MSLQREEDYVFLDTSRSDEKNRCSLLFMRPLKRLECFQGDDPEQFFAQLQALLAEGSYLAGWMAYEFSSLLDPERFSRLSKLENSLTPLASFGVYEKPFFFDHQTGETDFPFSAGTDSTAEFTVSNLSLSEEKEDYLQAIARIKEYIAAGDTYQVNYTLKLLFDFSGSVEALYRTLRYNQSVAYGALMRNGGQYICSFSPELFFAVDGETVQVRPMKGTMKRWMTLKEDQARAVALARDMKNRSENVMIVDLLRNDLGHLMHSLGDEAVVTDSLFDVERYESLLQMTSSIHAAGKGNVLDRVSLRELFFALFPCGSVTGAPKIRTMEIIAELETHRRGIYTGAVGYFSPKGESIFNVPIRTLCLQDGKGIMGIGSGIVYDSDPEREWDECLLKGRFLTHPVAPFYLMETLLFEQGTGYWLLDRHLQRLRESAEFFCFYYDEDKVSADLERLSRTFPAGATRLRLVLYKDGIIETAFQPCVLPLLRELPEWAVSPVEALPKVTLSKSRVDSSSVWQYHKTSKRDLFSREFERAQQESLFDVLFLNERCELSEGCISNVILFLAGQYVTPAVKSGLLAGTMRQHLLESSVALQEQVVYRDDLLRADALYCCNSVRGLVRVQLVAE